jgi:hypothetical protein
VHDPGPGHQTAVKTRTPRAKTEVGVLSVKIISLVQETYTLEHLATNEKTAASDVVGGLRGDPAQGRGSTESTMPGDTQNGGYPAATKPDFSRRVGDQRTEDTALGVVVGIAEQIAHQSRINLGVVVEQHDEIRTHIQGRFDSNVVAARVTEIDVVVEVARPGIALGQSLGGAVTRCIVHHPDGDLTIFRRLEPGERVKTPGRVIESVPVENDDGNPPH